MSRELNHFRLAQNPSSPSDLLHSTFEHIANQDTVWHYTDARGLIGIVEHNTLWATSTTTLNDPMELLYGLGILRETQYMLFGWNDTAHLDEARRKQLDDLVVQYVNRLTTTGVFVLCASTVNDSLSNWRAYAQLGGYAVGLARADLLGVLTPGVDIPICDEVNNSPGWHNVQYERSSQLAACGWLLRGLLRMIEQGDTQSITSTYMYEKFVSTVACMKHPTFIDEREARLFVSLRRDFPPSSGALNYRAGKYGVIPYFTLSGIVANSTAINARNGHLVGTLSNASQLPIDEVVVGPTTFSESKRASVQSLLATHGYGQATVSSSLSPARD